MVRKTRPKPDREGGVPAGGVSPRKRLEKGREERKERDAHPKIEGIRVDVNSYLVPDDFRRLTDLCVLFDDGRRCHMGVGNTRIFLVHPSHVTEANEILRKYNAEIANGKQVRPVAQT